MGYAGHRITVVESRTLTLDVEATGLPTPNIKWRIPSGRRLGPGQSEGRFSVLANNSLIISDTRVRDSGTYRSIASNPAGLAKVKSRVTVVGKDCQLSATFAYESYSIAGVVLCFRQT